MCIELVPIKISKASYWEVFFAHADPFVQTSSTTQNVVAGTKSMPEKARERASIWRSIQGNARLLC